MNRCSLWAVAAAGTALLMAACVNSDAGGPSKDDLLVEAGFVVRKADTPDRVAALKSLPPHQFVMRNSNGSVKYLYADPIDCDCIYVGGQHAYEQFHQKMAGQVQETQIRAILSSAPLPGEAGL
jgi:hypothetical protein